MSEHPLIARFGKFIFWQKMLGFDCTYSNLFIYTDKIIFSQIQNSDWSICLCTRRKKKKKTYLEEETSVSNINCYSTWKLQKCPLSFQDFFFWLLSKDHDQHTSQLLSILNQRSLIDFGMILCYWAQESNWSQSQNRENIDPWRYGDSCVSVLLNHITFESHWIKMNMPG